MRLIFDAAAPRVSEGGMRLRDNLTLALARTAETGSEVIVLVNDIENLAVTPNNMRYYQVQNTSHGWISRRKWLRKKLPDILQKLRGDAVFSSAGIVSDQISSRIGVISTVNNMLPFYLDTLWEVDSMTPAEWLKNQILRRQYIKSLRLADAVVLHSQHALDTLRPFVPNMTPKTIVRLTGVPKRASVSTELLEHPYDGRQYFCCFSVMRPYKNNIRLIDSYNLALSQEPELPDLLFVGLPVVPNYVQKMKDRIAHHGLQNKIKIIGAIDTQDVPRWLFFADVNYFPSLVETNSVIQSEILGLGAAMACSAIPPMSEVAGQAAELFDPRSIEDISHSFVDLYRSPARREELRQLSRSRALELSWDECGKAIWQAASIANSAFHQRAKA